MHDEIAAKLLELLGGPKGVADILCAELEKAGDERVRAGLLSLIVRLLDRD